MGRIRFQDFRNGVHALHFIIYNKGISEQWIRGVFKNRVLIFKIIQNILKLAILVIKVLSFHEKRPIHLPGKFWLKGFQVLASK